MASVWKTESDSDAEFVSINTFFISSVKVSSGHCGPRGQLHNKDK